MNELFKYSEWRKNEYLNKYSIPDKEEYYMDLMNIEHSFSGRMDVPLANTFIMESVQLIINSMEIFELGYFDCAYYSLRQAIEISTTIVYLSDLPEKEKKEKIENWKNTKEFPMQGQMLQQLYQYGAVISDMKVNMVDFFEIIKNISKKMNKHVHKQGLNNFYVSLNHPINSNKIRDKFIEEYIYFLENTIGIVAVMRLAIDPYPILLMDEEILYRCFDSMTEPYSAEFVGKYIDSKTIEDYKRTQLYINHYNGHMMEEKKNNAVFEVMKYQVIDVSKRKDILSQIHLLDSVDACAVFIALSSTKVVKIYAYGGMQMYFTNRKTNRKSTEYSGMEFKKFEDSKQKYNQIYDEAFISVFKYELDKEQIFFVEHNEILTEEEINKIKNLEYEK